VNNNRKGTEKTFPKEDQMGLTEAKRLAKQKNIDLYWRNI
jgi:hypothetical protein